MSAELHNRLIDLRDQANVAVVMIRQRGHVLSRQEAESRCAELRRLLVEAERACQNIPMEEG